MTYKNTIVIIWTTYASMIYIVYAFKNDTLPSLDSSDYPRTQRAPVGHSRFRKTIVL